MERFIYFNVTATDSALISMGTVQLFMNTETCDIHLTLQNYSFVVTRRLGGARTFGEGEQVAYNRNAKSTTGNLTSELTAIFINPPSPIIHSENPARPVACLVLICECNSMEVTIHTENKKAATCFRVIQGDFCTALGESASRTICLSRLAARRLA